MVDSVIAGTGNSRYLRTSLAADTTWEDALAMLRAGTFPIDLAGINAAGFTTVGTALTSATLLKAAVCTALGLDADATPSDAWEEIISRINGKQDAPSSEGTAGQVLGLDNNLAPVWVNQSGGGGGLTPAIKVALLQLAEKVAYIDANGQDYYDDLYDALYPPAGLVSISADYTQSGAVYTTDTLDSLKSDLVVTANYDDSSTATIPGTDYTLSGTLTEGTSTVTVAYGGKTATFSVTVTERPPYTFYDYLQGDGNAYINTGLLGSEYFTLSYDHEIKAARYNSGTIKAIYGVRQQWGTANARQLWWNNSAYGVNFCSSTSTAVADASSDQVPITLKTTKDKKILRDGVEVTYTQGNIGSITHTGPITLFAECTGGQGSGYKAISGTNAYAGAYSACRIYYFKVWDANGNLVSDIKPALRISDNSIGMYDSVRNMFLENANNTGTFSLGNE